MRKRFNPGRRIAGPAAYGQYGALDRSANREESDPRILDEPRRGTSQSPETFATALGYRGESVRGSRSLCQAVE